MAIVKKKKKKSSVSCSCETKVRVRMVSAKKKRKTITKSGMAKGYAAGGSPSRIASLEKALSYYQSIGDTMSAGMIQNALVAERAGQSTAMWALPQKHIRAMIESTMHGARRAGMSKGRRGFSRGYSSTRTSGGSPERIRELEWAVRYYRGTRDLGLAAMIEAALEAERSGKDTSQWALPQAHLMPYIREMSAPKTRFTGRALGRAKSATNACRTAKGRFKKCS